MSDSSFFCFHFSDVEMKRMVFHFSSFCFWPFSRQSLFFSLSPFYLQFLSCVSPNGRERKEIRFGSLNATLSLCSLMKDVSNQFDLTSNPEEKWRKTKGRTKRRNCSVTRWLDYSYSTWPFMTMDFCPITLKSCQSRFTILPKIKQTYKNLPKAYTISPKWGNFAKSGHTVPKNRFRLCHPSYTDRILSQPLLMVRFAKIYGRKSVTISLQVSLTFSMATSK